MRERRRARAAAYFGELGDGSDRIIGMLLDEQLDDGGWNCDAPESRRAPRSTRRSACSRACRVRAGRAASPTRRSPTPARGEEYLLERRLFRRVDRRADQGALRRLLVPAVLVLRRAARRSTTSATPAAHPTPPRRRHRARARAARRRRTLAGRNAAPGRGVLRARRAAGEPSRWNTLRALQVLRWWDEGRIGPQGPMRPSTDQSAAGTDSPSSRAMRARAFCSLGDTRPSTRTPTASRIRVSVTAGHRGPPQPEQLDGTRERARRPRRRTGSGRAAR